VHHVGFTILIYCDTRSTKYLVLNILWLDSDVKEIYYFDTVSTLEGFLLLPATTMVTGTRYNVTSYVHDL
jgi:hypothetical protein